MKTILHINQHVIRSNSKTGEREPVITVKDYKQNRYAREVVIDGPCRIVYSPDKPLSCGAQVWIETTAPVFLTGEKAAAEAVTPRHVGAQPGVQL